MCNEGNWFDFVCFEIVVDVVVGDRFVGGVKFY